MIGARVGAVLSARKRGLSLTQREDDLATLAKKGHESIEDRTIWENSQSKLTFRRIPYREWVFGAMFLLGALFVEVMLVFVIRESHTWMQVGLVMLLFIIGYCFASAGQVETVVFDKKSGTMLMSYTTIACKKRYVCYTLDCVKGVKAYHKGLKSGGVDTRHYVIIVEVEQNTVIPVQIMWCTDEKRVKK